jgi:hypothetical protein
VSRRFVDALWPAKPDFHGALPSQVAIFERAEPTDKQHQIPLIKGSKNVEFHPLRAIFRVASANSTNKGHRDTCGRSRHDRDHTLRVPIKDIYLYPLCSDFKERLCA